MKKDRILSSRNNLYTMDIRDQECSKPVVAIKARLDRMVSGESLEVLANDSARDDVVRVFGSIQGHHIREEEDGDTVHIHIRKK